MRYTARRAGHNGAKKVVGCKRFIAVDSDSQLLAVAVSGQIYKTRTAGLP